MNLLGRLWNNNNMEFERYKKIHYLFRHPIVQEDLSSFRQPRDLVIKIVGMLILDADKGLVFDYKFIHYHQSLIMIINYC